MIDAHKLGVVLEKLYENQVALAASIEELALWVEIRADDESLAENIRGALETLDRNADTIGAAIMALRQPAAQ